MILRERPDRDANAHVAGPLVTSGHLPLVGACGKGKTLRLCTWTHHAVSERTVAFAGGQRYLNEFSFQFNNWKAADVLAATGRRMALAGNLPYAKLVEENAFALFVHL